MELPVTERWIPYCGIAPLPAELWSRWNFDPLLIAAIGMCAAAAWIFSGRNSSGQSWYSGMTVLGLAILYVSPLCALSSALFSARVVHHLILVALIAPLVLRALPEGAIRPWGGLGFWTACPAVIFWLWHAPPAYAWALSSDAAYWLMQATLLTSALFFWAAIRQTSAPASVSALLATMVQMGLLGALLTFSTTPFYLPHLLVTHPWGLSPLEDQQLAGLIMWAPGSAIYLLGALAILARWLHQGETKALRS